MNLYDKTLISFWKKNFFYSLIKPVFFFCGILSQVFCSLYFFVIRDFFGGSGITDLNFLFLSIPFVSIVVLPSLCTNNFLSSREFRTFLPSYKVIFVRIMNVAVQYYLIQLSLVSVVECVSLFGSVDYGQVWTSYIFLFFYSFCASSICVFVFQLFDSIVLSFCFSAVTIGIFSSIHLLSLNASSSSLLSLIVRTLSFSWRFNNAAGGVLSSVDILFFLITGFVFFFFSCLLSQYKKGFAFSVIHKVNVVLMLLIFAFLYANSTIYKSKKDYSYNQSRTISDFGKRILSLRQNKISITYYRSPRIFSIFPQAHNVSDFLLEYGDYGVSVQEVDADSEENSKILASYGVYPQNIRISGNNKAEFVGVHSAIVIEYLDKYEVIPFMISTDSLEYEMDGRLLHLLTGKERTVNVLVANDLSVEHDYDYVVPWISAQGFRCNLIDVNEADIVSQLTGDDKLLLVIGSSKLSLDHCAQLEEFLGNGGKAIFCVSPFDADLVNNWSISKSQNQNLFTMFAKYGIRWTGRLIRDLSCSNVRMDSDTNADGSKSSSIVSQYISYWPWPSLFPQENAPSGLCMYWPSQVDVSFCDAAKPYLFSSSLAQSIGQSFNAYGSLFDTFPFDFMSSDTQSDKGVYPLAFMVDGKVNRNFSDGMMDCNFLLIPDQYFVNSFTIGYSGGFEACQNFNFLVTQFLKLGGEVELASLHDKAYSNRSLKLYKISDPMEFEKAKKKVFFIVFAVVPSSYVVLYFVLVLVRKQKINKMLVCHENKSNNH